ncbi:MAG: peptidyl-prolyl cis-trans isomerase SurA [Woeseiaceae bacterium]|jgi:peptidyl-prolyl cis-trans isomerase SurA
MNKIKHLIPFFLLISAATTVLAEELSETGEFVDGVAAIVNEGVVLKSELARQQDLIIQHAVSQNMQLPPADILQEQVLERLINEEVQMQRADRIGIQVSDQMLNQAIAEIARNAGFSFEEMPAILARDGVDYAEYRRDTRRQLIIEQLKRIDVVQRISVSPREIDMCIADLEDNVVVNSDFDLSHILISVPEAATAEQYAEAEEEAQGIYSELIDGGDFGELAIRYSDSQTGLEGGSLGWRKGDQLPTLFSDVVGSMQEGDFSAPIRAVSGYHLVKVNEIRGVNQKSEIDQMLTRHILVTTNEIIDEETAKQQLEDAVLRIKGGEEFSEVAKLLSDDPGSASQGGETGWTGPGTFVPEFEEVANALEIGVMSEPFRSRFGWHVLEVMDRRVYDNTDDLKETNCVQRVRNGKLTNETELWTRRIRDEAFVDSRI